MKRFDSPEVLDAVAKAIEYTMEADYERGIANPSPHDLTQAAITALLEQVQMTEQEVKDAWWHLGEIYDTSGTQELAVQLVRDLGLIAPPTTGDTHV